MQDADTKSERLAVEDRLQLESSAAWLDAPSALLLPHGGRTFEVKASLRLPQIDAADRSRCMHEAPRLTASLALAILVSVISSTYISTGFELADHMSCRHILSMAVLGHAHGVSMLHAQN